MLHGPYGALPVELSESECRTGTASWCTFLSAAFFALVSLLYMPGLVLALWRAFGIAPKASGPP